MKCPICAQEYDGVECASCGYRSTEPKEQGEAFSCPGCGAAGRGAFCQYCGGPAPKKEERPATKEAEQPPAKGVYSCPNCGTKSTGHFCSNCGFAIDAISPPEPVPPAAPVKNVYTARENVHKPAAPALMISRRNRWSAFVLCLFAGGFGFHRFYVGKTGTGLLYFFTGGLFLAGWIYDLICILTGIFRDGEGKYLK